MPAVPDDLRRRFQKWDAKGRPSQEAFEWEKKNWQKYLGNSSILEALPNPIDRAGVLETFKLVHDPGSALDAYIASYLWGLRWGRLRPVPRRKGHPSEHGP